MLDGVKSTIERKLKGKEKSNTFKKNDDRKSRSPPPGKYLLALTCCVTLTQINFDLHLH